MIVQRPSAGEAIASASLDAVGTLPALLQWRIGQTPSEEAYRQFDPGSGKWKSFSWRRIGEEVGRWRRALKAENLARGDRVAILMPNGIPHVAMDLAALSCGYVPVPMHALDNPDSIAFILKDSGAAVLLVDSAERWQAIVKSAQPGPSLKRVVCAKGAGDQPEGGLVVALEQWLQSATLHAGLPQEDIAPDDLAAIVYTSGTTGRPKGVMLSHRNVVSNVKAIARRLPPRPDDVFLSFLPLSHTFERTCGYYFPIAAGACVAFARSVKQLPEDMKEVRPTVLISVPRIYERIYARVMEQRTALGAGQRAIFDAAIAIGGARFDARQGGTEPSTRDRIAWPVLERLVAARVLAEFGGRLRMALSGGAPIGEPVVRFFLSLGLDLLQGYGMTESSPVVSVNTPDDNECRSVGRPLDGVGVGLGENQELLVRGPNVMIGYWNQPDATLRVKGADGWLHTGDQARIENGRIFITGRIKDIIVTSTGEKIPPNDLETAILADPLFAQAMVVGENRPYLAVLAVLDPQVWDREKPRGGGNAGGIEAQFLLRRMAQAVKSFPSYATPHAVWWTTEPWTVDAGLLTPTLKNKRAAIAARFASEIERLYPRRLSA